MSKDILLDTNIIRRLMENDSAVIEFITEIKESGYSFRVSDMSLFELVNSIENDAQYYKLLQVLYNNKIHLIIKELFEKFEQDFLEWFQKPMAVINMKKQLLPSFSFTLSTVLTDFTKAVIIFIANKLTSDYSSEFYSVVMRVVEKLDTSHFDEVIKNSFLCNAEKLNKRLPIEFRDLVIRLLTYNELLKTQSTFDSTTFQIEYDIQDCKHKNQTFKDICCAILTEEDLRFNTSDIGDEMDAEFVVNYFKGVLCHKESFKINDLTDYINFKYAFKLCDYYFTNDSKSLNRYKRYFVDDKIQNYIQKTKDFSKQYLLRIKT